MILSDGYLGSIPLSLAKATSNKKMQRPRKFNWDRWLNSIQTSSHVAIKVAGVADSTFALGGLFNPI